MNPRTAVVTVVRGRHEHLARQERSLRVGNRADVRVVVSMDDPGVVVPGADVVPLELVDGRLPLAAARNTGAERALQHGAEVLVFLDVDCLAGPGLLEGYERAVVQDPGTVWSGPVTYLPPGLTDEQSAAPELLDDPHPARPAPARGELLRDADPALFWSLSFALSAAAWGRTGGFHEEYLGYGGEDTDFGQQVVACGLALGWTGDARAYHQHHPVERPPVGHLADILRNGRLFADRWGRWPMEGWLREFEALGLVERRDGGWVSTSIS